MWKLLGVVTFMGVPLAWVSSGWNGGVVLHGRLGGRVYMLVSTARGISVGVVVLTTQCVG